MKAVLLVLVLSGVLSSSVFAQQCNCDRFVAETCSVFDLGAQLEANVFECTSQAATDCDTYFCTSPVTGSPGIICTIDTIPTIIQNPDLTCSEVPTTVTRLQTSIWINEVHYLGGDQEANFQYIEIAGPVGTVLSGNYRIELYDGQTRSLYNTVPMFGVLSDGASTGATGTGIGLQIQTITGTTIRTGFGIFTNGQSGNDNNGPANAIALVDITTGFVSQFISYLGAAGTEFGEGTDGTALDGTAAGLTPTPMGVNEVPGSGNEDSLQLQGTGLLVTDFTWASTPVPETRLAVNANQNFV
eukprot:CAMPEP_0182449526 /NCGR_PEP_ID=MMETSP1172-20130603/35091_1 /TAXON_ID=708627 /ORGANISM="Timspurckia oligopyrenoides, Strain CCMP3278" /LENGTH=299 /DNA_ID=CAMNT_0024646843 /DNA_START=188 /DNA_END=1087 /DNA_ORIENTATION=+